MKIKYDLQPEPKTVDQFAKQHDLTMKVGERESWQVNTGRPRFYAEFEGVEVKIGRMLCSFYGDGDTIFEAIKDYFDRIQGALLVLNAADKEKRKEIRVPYDLKVEWTDE
jgi:hypothetical protein